MHDEWRVRACESGARCTRPGGTFRAILSLDFRILGPLEIAAAGHSVELQGPKPRALLAIMLLRANEPVPTDRLVEELWSGRPPATAAKILQGYVSRLRRALGADLVVTRPGSYELRMEPAQIDLHRFERLVRDARSANVDTAASLLHGALSLWRGQPLVDFAAEDWAQPEIARLEELRLTVIEERIEADLTLGRHGQLIDEIDALVSEHPHREGLRGQLMLALYRAGRQADALDTYRRGRAVLSEELGLEPSQRLRALERAILAQDLELELPAVQSEAGGRRRSAIRVPETSFVGRTRELEEVRETLTGTDVRLLTLTGPAGTGKTRLALEGAVALGEDFPDGVVLVELAPIADHARVASAISDALGLGGLRGVDPIEALVAFLRTRRTLLVLDNFEHVLRAGPVVSILLAGAPGLTVLATSRAPLRVLEEAIYAVPALELPDPAAGVGRLRRSEAVRLFVDRAREARAEFELTEANEQAVAVLCVRLDGLPLALELAAARVRLLSPHEILERMQARLEPLRASPGTRRPERHLTLRAAIEWSCDLLAEPTRELFTSLGVFAGAFTSKGAEEIACDPEIDVVGAIETLLDDSLLKVERAAGGEPRFGMLETVHEYALERLEERGDADAVRRRHASFYLRLAADAEPGLLGPQQLDWLERLDAERDNVRAALSWALESGESDVGLRIAADLWRFWQLRSLDREGREWLEQLLAGPTGSPGVRARAQSRIASLALVHGDVEAVRRYIETSLPTVRELGYEREVLTYGGLLATAYLALGDTDRALELCDEVLEAVRQASDPIAKAYGLWNAGVVLAAVGRLDDAREVVEQSLDLAREVGNVRSVGNWSRSLGHVVLAQGDVARARMLVDESLVVHRRLGDRWGISHSLSSLALLAQHEGDARVARRLLLESFEIECEVSDHAGLVSNFAVAARLATAEGRLDSATRMYAFASTLRSWGYPHPVDLGWPDPAQQIAELRIELGEEAFAESWEHGQAMSLDDAVALALAEN